MPNKTDIDKKRLLSRRTLAVKTIAAQTNWLDAPIRCSDGVLLWKTSDAGFLRPDVELLYNTQRAIYKIRQDMEAARKALGDVDFWIDSRQRKLEEAKLLCALRVAPASETPTLSGLLNLLVAQSVAVDPMEPIAHSVLKHGQQAIPALLSLINDERLPLLSRTYAAIVLGAIQGRSTATVKFTEPNILRAYKYGTTYGIDKYPELTNRVLFSKHGDILARTINESLANSKHFTLDQTSLLELCARGVSVEIVTSLCTNVTQVQSVFSEINKLHAELEYPHLVEERQWLRSLFATHLARHCINSPKPETPHLVAALFGRILEILKTVRIKNNKRNELHETIQKLVALPCAVRPELEADCIRVLNAKLKDTWLVKEIQNAGKNMDLIRATLTREFNHDLRHIPHHLMEYEDADLLIRANSCGVLAALHHRNGIEKEQIQLAIQIRKLTKAKGCTEILTILDLIKSLRNSALAHKQLLQILSVFKDLAQKERISAWEFEELFELIKWPGTTTRQAIEIIVEQLPRVAQCKQSSPVQSYTSAFWQAYGILIAALVLNRLPEAVAKECLDAITDCMCPPKGRPLPAEADLPCGVWQSAPLIAAYLSDGDPTIASKTFYSCLSRRFKSADRHKWLVEINLPATRQTFDQLQRAFIFNPADCSPFFEQLRLCKRLSINTQQILSALENEPNHCQCTHCNQITPFGPAAITLWNRYCRNQNILSGSHEAPQSISKFIDLPNDLAKELHYLEKNNPPATRSEKVAKRIERLRWHKQFPAESRAGATHGLCKELEKLVAISHVQAATKLLQEAIASTCNQEAFAKLGLTNEQLFDLLVLRFSVEKNRTELTRLLKACLRGDLNYPLRQPANKHFLNEIKEKGIDAEVWLSTFPAYFNVHEMDIGNVTIKLESNPIEILKMGVYFDTCLSFDGVNAFSSIANAVDLNKRVIYVRDRKGKVIARKLIGIADNGKLVGFRTYCMYSARSVRQWIISAVNQYAKALATACGIELDNGTSSTVPLLVSKSWYNDGPVSWNDDKETDLNSYEGEPAPGAPQLCFGIEKERPQMQALSQAETEPS